MSIASQSRDNETAIPPDTSSQPGWVHVCNGLDPRRDGGMVPSILGLTGAIKGSGSVAIVTPTPSSLGETQLPRGVRLIGPEADLERFVRCAEVVHLHGLWQGHTRRGARAARQARVPYIIASHGMAEPWALRHKAMKKRIYLSLVEKRNLQRAACLHALSRPEIGHLRALTPKTPIALVPNGVRLEPFADLPARSLLEREFPELEGKFLLLFLSRLHVKKGLDLLAQALLSIRLDHPEVHLLLAGNDDGARQPFLQQMASFGLASRVTCLGHVAGERAREVWGAADAFILPSYSEGFSMAILEALAARKPAIITTACHFPELARVRGGIVVEPDRASVTQGLRELLERTPAERETLAASGRSLVESRYTWAEQGRRLTEVYQWLEGGGPEPEAVAETEGSRS